MRERGRERGGILVNIVAVNLNERETGERSGFLVNLADGKTWVF